MTPDLDLFTPIARQVVDMVSIKALRRRFPDVQWKAVRSGFGWCYESSDGSVVRACSALHPRYDGDDDTFVTEWWRYFNDGRAPQRMD